MGRPKLLLDVGGQSVIARLLAVLETAGVGNRLIVVDPADDELKTEIEKQGGLALVPPIAPPEMRDSVAIGLSAVRYFLSMRGEVADPHAPWLLIPGDHPVVVAPTVKALLEASRQNRGRIVVPAYNGRRGHPTVFAWRHALAVDRIPEGQGFNWILKEYAADVIEVAVENEGVILDLDTPDDYQRLLALWE